MSLISLAISPDMLKKKKKKDHGNRNGPRFFFCSDLLAALRPDGAAVSGEQSRLRGSDQGVEELSSDAVRRSRFERICAVLVMM